MLVAEVRDPEPIVTSIKATRVGEGNFIKSETILPF